MNIKTIIFDMDGTILDTVEDLRVAINHSLSECGHRHDFTYEDTKYLFGSGVKVAIERALCMEAGAGYDELIAVGTAGNDGSAYGITEEEVTRIIQVYKPFYEKNCLVNTCAYPGIIELLKKLRSDGVKTAVVSNKPHEAVLSLCDVLFKDMFDYAAGEQPGITRKPAPDMLLAAMKELGSNESDSVYIGDSEIDMQTAANCNLPCITVDWGFRSAAFLKNNGAEFIAGTADEVYNIIITH